MAKRNDCFWNADYTLTHNASGETSSDAQSNSNSVPNRHDGRIVTVICVEQLVKGTNTLRLLVFYRRIGHSPRPKDVVGDEEPADSHTIRGFAIHGWVIILIDIIEYNIELTLDLIDQIQRIANENFDTVAHAGALDVAPCS